ncbi:hypothetical protein D3C73_1331480 [compost metagenome]
MGILLYSISCSSGAPEESNIILFTLSGYSMAKLKAILPPADVAIKDILSILR